MTTHLKLTHGFSSQNPIYPHIAKNVFVSEGEDFERALRVRIVFDYEQRSK